MPISPNLSLPFAESGQAQKHAALNESLRILDALVQLAVAGIADAPPAEPGNGARVIVGTSPTGAFADHASEVAAFQDGGWVFLAPQPGWRAWDADEENLLVWTGAEWSEISAGGGGGSGDVEGPGGGVADGELAVFDGTSGKAIKKDRGTVSHLGVGAPFDGTDTDTSNRLVVRANRSVFYAIPEAETPGSGDIKIQVSKEAEGNSASFFFATDFSPRAEFGLVEGDSFMLKVSPDGEDWIEALVFDPHTGAAAFREIAGVRRQLAEDLWLHVDGSTGDDGNDGLTPETAFATIQKAVDTAASLDLGIHDVNVNVADGTYSAKTQLRTLVGAGTVHIIGNTGTPANVLVNPAAIGAGLEGGAFWGNYSGSYALRGVKIEVATSGRAISIWGRANLSFQSVDFGACATHHILCAGGGSLEITGAYTISGGSGIHLSAGTNALINRNVAGTLNVALTGTPAFSAAFASASTAGVINLGSVSYTGAATGARYSVSGNGVINTSGGGANYFPGDSAGTAASGGVYI